MCHKEKQWNLYNFYRNKTVELINVSKKNYFEKENVGKLWRHLKDVTSGPSSQSVPNHLIYEGES